AESRLILFAVVRLEHPRAVVRPALQVRLVAQDIDPAELGAGEADAIPLHFDVVPGLPQALRELLDGLRIARINPLLELREDGVRVAALDGDGTLRGVQRVAGHAGGRTVLRGDWHTSRYGTRGGRHEERRGRIGELGALLRGQRVEKAVQRG